MTMSTNPPEPPAEDELPLVHAHGALAAEAGAGGSAGSAGSAGIEITSARETVSAETLPARAARELGCAAGAPCFRSDRVSVDAESRPIVYDRVFIPGDRFRITRQLHYDRSVTA